MIFKNNFKIGNLSLPNNIIYAPLAEYTDFAFRRLIRLFHKGLIFCEMIKMEALVREKSINILKYTENMRPIGAQICGSNPKIAKDAAKIIEDLGFDIIDLNCGCPVPKIVKDGSGSALLKNPSLIFEILNAIKSSVKIPVTVKIRLGWDENSICAKEIVQIAADAGCSAITIHGRTKKQGYSGKADWNYIKECKNLSANILIIGNGDIYSPYDAEKIFNETKCDGIMIARGMLQNPNIACDIEEYFHNNKSIKTNLDKRKTILQYINYCIEEKGEEKTIFDIRKICGWLLRDNKNIKNLRIGINSSASASNAIKLINEFQW
jgi:tRNA-dihydrouridine synthase B